jgi:hypothetical protein
MSKSMDFLLLQLHDIFFGNVEPLEFLNFLMFEFFQ